MNEKKTVESDVVYDRNYSFPVLEINNPLATAKISLYGGNIISYIPVGGKPVIWMNPGTSCEIGRPIAGGIPVCWPWFGKREGKPAHGFVRTAMWQLVNICRLADGSTRIVLAVDETACDPVCCEIKFRLELHVTVGRSLETTLLVFNTGPAEYSYESSLHAYFAIGDAQQIYLTGLNDTSYEDKAAGNNTRSIQYGRLEIDREINRIFFPSQETVEIVDACWRRTVKIEKSGSLATVIWNPWSEKSADMLGSAESFRRMICVETSQVRNDSRIIRPGEISVVSQKISVTNWSGLYK